MDHNNQSPFLHKPKSVQIEKKTTHTTLKKRYLLKETKVTKKINPNSSVESVANGAINLRLHRLFYSQSGGGSLRSMAKPRLAVGEEGEELNNSSTRGDDVAAAGEAAK